MSKNTWLVSMLLAIVGLGAGAGLSACSSPDTAARVDPIGPDRAQFEPVAKVLNQRCGTLDCHGNLYRNLRLYGYGGLRLPADPVNLPDRDTTTAELDASYDAVIGLEPESMRDVVLDKGFAPERLSLVRKARNTERHKGGAPLTQGDDADVCITSWLANATNVKACESVINGK